MDIIITAAEINDRHGVGILLQRIFPERSHLMSLRTMNLYGGVQNFAPEDYLLGSIGLSRKKIFTQIQQRLSHHKIDRVLCVPYHVEEVYAALALYELFGAKICTYVMDDRNILVADIPDRLMAELMAKSSLRLAISPEMRDVYASKYGIDIYFVPPVVPGELVNTEMTIINTEQQKSGAILGNIWGAKWLDLLRRTIRTTGVKIDWYGNTGADWKLKDRARLLSDGIIERGFLPTEAEVAQVLRTYGYVVVPSGTLDRRDDNPATSWLSLPSRLPFILATTSTPIIVLGNPHTAAGRFVQRMGIGVVCDYDGESFWAAVNDVTQPARQQQMRQRSIQLADRFVNVQMDQWIWQSLAIGKPIDSRFEDPLNDKLDYTSSFTTCLGILRDLHPQSSAIDYFRQHTELGRSLRHWWLKFKGKL